MTPDLGAAVEGSSVDDFKDSATGPKGNGQIRDMLSWALARHHALEEENKCLGTIFTRMVSQEYTILFLYNSKQTPTVLPLYL